MNIHPFPARMASELALSKTKLLTENSVVLDPMAGSGTVIRAASQHGHRCIGLDVDPLAVLMAKVATHKLDEDRFDQLVKRLLKRAQSLKVSDVNLPWFDRDTENFVRYWFAPQQRRALKRLAHVLHTHPSLSDNSPEANAARVAFSRLIITKDRGASLARDVSHSRPHRVGDDNDFDAFSEYEKSAQRIERRLSEMQHGRRPIIRLGDARSLPWVRDSSIDVIMTSPPYLNAIDYMRGHRLSLVWLGYSFSHLRKIRAGSIGAERGLEQPQLVNGFKKIRAAFGTVGKLPPRFQGMIDRYSVDLLLLMKQSSRVLKADGRAVFVVGNSCVRGVFISNARGLEAAANIAGLTLIEETERELPAGSRYLPIPIDRESALGRRMRTEAVLTFAHRDKKAS